MFAAARRAETSLMWLALMVTACGQAKPLGRAATAPDPGGASTGNDEALCADDPDAGAHGTPTNASALATSLAHGGDAGPHCAEGAAGVTGDNACPSGM